MSFQSNLQGTRQQEFYVGRGDIDVAGDPIVGVRTNSSGEIEFRESGPGTPWRRIGVADQTLLEILAGATNTSVQDWSNTVQSAGVISGGEITDGGSGTVDIAAIQGVVKTTNSAIGANLFFNLGASTSVALTDETTNYVAVDYNGGTPQLVVSTTDTANGYTIFNLGRVFREGTGVDIIPDGLQIQDFSNRVHQHHIETDLLQFVSGAKVFAIGTRNVGVTAGVLYAGLNRFETDVVDTSDTDTFEYYYYTGTAWTESDASQINNSQYNDVATGLEDLGNNQYGVHWVYKGLGNSCYVVYGQDSYLLSAAQTAQPPSTLPAHISEFGVLRAKIIIQEGASAFTEIENVTDVSFVPGSVADHNGLSGLQGGAAAQYYHLTSSQYSALSGYVVGPASAVDNRVVVFDETTGKLIKGAPVTLNPAGDLSAIKTVVFGTPASVTAASLAATVDFSVAQKVHLGLGDQVSCAITFNTPNGVGNYILRITQGSTIATTTITWLTEASEDVLAPSGALTVASGLNSVTIIGVYFDGTNFHLTSSSPMESIM